MRTNQSGSRPSRARSGRRVVLTALLAAAALVIALAGAVQPAAARSAAPGSPTQPAGTAHTVSGVGPDGLLVFQIHRPMHGRRAAEASNHVGVAGH